MKLIDRPDSLLTVIDVQGRLAESMAEKDRLFRNLEILVRGMHLLEVPVIWTEQVPAKLGATIPRLQPLIGESPLVAKSSFSCWGDSAFRQRLSASGRRTVLLCGIEAHVCVYQTAMDLLEEGLRVELVVDAVDSRDHNDREVAIARLRRAGVGCLSSEMLLFELQRVAEGKCFRELIELVKSR